MPPPTRFYSFVKYLQSLCRENRRTRTDRPLQSDSVVNHLPRELLDQILSNLTRKSDLSSAALVSTWWWSSARVLLLRDILVVDYLPGNTIRTFISFLDTNHDVCDFIQCLTLSARPEISQDPLYSGPTVDRETLDAVLGRLCRLNSLRLVGVRFGSERPPHRKFRRVRKGPPRTYDLQRLTLVRSSFNVDTPEDVVAFFSAFHHIGELCISRPGSLRKFASAGWGGTTAAVVDAVDRLSVPSALSVSRLYMEYARDSMFYCEIIRRTSTAALESFTDRSMTLTNELVDTNIMDLLRESGGNLTHITFIIEDVPWRSPTIPDLIRAHDHFSSDEMRSSMVALSALRSVTLRLGISRDIGWSSDATRAVLWSVLIAMLHSFPPIVRRIEITLFYVTPSPGDRSFPYDNMPVWCIPEFDLRALGSCMQRFSELCSVVIGGTVELIFAEKQRVEDELVEFASRGILMFGMPVRIGIQ